MSYDGYEYPTDEQLEELTRWKLEWDAAGKHPYFAPFFALIKELWWMPDWGWTEFDGSDDGRPIRVYQISTGGWSGNESLLGAMKENFVVWSMTFNAQRRGGHYTFWIPVEDNSAHDAVPEAS